MHVSNSHLRRWQLLILMAGGLSACHPAPSLPPWAKSLKGRLSGPEKRLRVNVQKVSMAPWPKKGLLFRQAGVELEAQIYGLKVTDKPALIATAIRASGDAQVGLWNKTPRAGKITKLLLPYDRRIHWLSFKTPHVRQNWFYLAPKKRWYTGGEGNNSEALRGHMHCCDALAELAFAEQDKSKAGVKRRAVLYCAKTAPLGEKVGKPTTKKLLKHLQEAHLKAPAVCVTPKAPKRVEAH